MNELELNQIELGQGTYNFWINLTLVISDYSFFKILIVNIVY